MSIPDSIKDLFQRARDKNEFNFVSTLINYKGMGSVYFTSNLLEWFNAIEYYETIYLAEKNAHKKVRMGLLIYSTFFESSDLYNLIGNLSRNVLGYRGSAYLYWKHDNSDRWLGTGEKVSLVIDILTDAQSSEIVTFLSKIHDKQLRNSFFHSSYALEDDTYHIKDSGSESYSIKENLFPAVDAVLEFFHCFKLEYQNHYSSYTENKRVTGDFPTSMEIIILGSEKGLVGFIANGSYIKLENNFWTAMNITLNTKSETRRFIVDELKRFISKDKIRTDDGSLLHLEEVISERNLTDESMALAVVFQRFADMKNYESSQEENNFKKADLQRRALLFYQKMLKHNKSKFVTNDIAVLKYLVSLDSNKIDLMNESLNDFIECIEREPQANSIKNAKRVIDNLKSKGQNVEKEIGNYLCLLRKNKTPELSELILEIIKGFQVP